MSPVVGPTAGTGRDPHRHRRAFPHRRRGRPAQGCRLLDTYRHQWLRGGAASGRDLPAPLSCSAPRPLRSGRSSSCDVCCQSADSRDPGAREGRAADRIVGLWRGRMTTWWSPSLLPSWSRGSKRCSGAPRDSDGGAPQWQSAVSGSMRHTSGSRSMAQRCGLLRRSMATGWCRRPDARHLSARATRLCSATFRDRDLPHHPQILAGLRPAKDVT